MAKGSCLGILRRELFSKSNQLTHRGLHQPHRVELLRLCVPKRCRTHPGSIPCILEELRRRVLGETGPYPFQLLYDDGAQRGIAHGGKCFLQVRMEATGMGTHVSCCRCPDVEAVGEKLVACAWQGQAFWELVSMVQADRKKERIY